MDRGSSISALLSLISFLFILIPAASANVNPHGDIKIACNDCHTPEGWNILRESPEFSHANTGFPLTGVHKDTNCKKCHTDLHFSNIGILCADCHTDIHRAQFGIECQNCHSPLDWQDRQDVFGTHADRGFPLLGVHIIVDCDACHISQGREEFSGTPISCDGCHIDNFNGTLDPNHSLANFSLDCQECHSVVSSNWNQAQFEHTLDFVLRGAHTNVNCAGCHSQTFASTPNLCFGCHENDFNSVPNPSHTTLGFPTDCETCHNEIAWQGAEFDHIQTTGYELVGIHASLGCVDCHVNNQYDLPQDCIGCHQNDYNSVTDPNHVNAVFPEDCTQCHTQSGWSPATFDHGLTSFPLTGQHMSLDCSGCHTNGQFSGTPTDCWSCHEENYNGVGDPNHVANNFSQDCTLCHSIAGWQPSTFNHSQTAFPLTGAHTVLNCVECHSTGYPGTPADCFSCHEDDYNGVPDPNHVANNFGQDCTQCHTTSGWDVGTFNHGQTQFPLTGAHMTIDCIDCHAGGYVGMPTDCWSCHEDDYTGVPDPNHVVNNFNHDCTMCHSTNGWTPVSFDHSQTQFPLTGVHLTLNCADCHANGYSGTPADCYSCHEDDYTGVTDPNHVTNNFNHDCTVCHTTNGWTPVSFDHSQTQFPLTGVHLTLNCADCHANGYSGTPTDCYSCHEDDYTGVVDPSHTTNNFPHDCTICHTTNGWTPVSFDHSQTQFPLTGVHLTLNCVDCHAGGYSGTPTDCWSCHEDDYTGVVDPNHTTNNFPHDCTICHSTNGWTPSTFDHSQTAFPLTGAHQTLNCTACHSNGYPGTPTACFACHEDDYNNVGDPDHVGGNYNHICTICHNTNSWATTTFNHNLTSFPLTGAHLIIPCIACHSTGYNNTPTSCFACHEDDYNNTTDPNHQLVGFPTNCEQCHITSNWEQVTWDHDNQYFPIYSGRHEGEWNLCADCHVNANNYEVFECIFCHFHNQPDMAVAHLEVPGYVYQSIACYNCHPDGE